MKTFLIFTTVFCVGCAGSAEWTEPSVGAATDEIDQGQLAASMFHDASKRVPPGTLEFERSGGAVGGEKVSKTPQTPIDNSGSMERKIIYTANVNLVVDNFDGFEEKVRKTVADHGGYVASSNLDRMQGERRSGRWTARIPVERYESFMDAVSKLGVPTSQNQNAQDVTEEFVDLEARIANKKKLEERILELLDRPDDKIQHVIEVERELARVREEIERMEGRLRFLKDQTAMTTVSISAREERDYQPPQAPTLGSRVSTAWTNSLDRAGNFVQNFVVFVVGNVIAMAAWLVGIVVAFFILRWAWRKIRPRRQAVAS